MAEVTNDLIYEVLKRMQDQLFVLAEGQRAIGEKLHALRGHQLAMQRDFSNMYSRLDVLDLRLERVERRLGLHEPA